MAGIPTTPSLNTQLANAVAALEATRKERDEALDLLATMFDAYEDGPDCYEDPEDYAGHLGKAVHLDDAAFDRIADILNKHRPRNSEVTPNAKSQATDAALSRQSALTDGLGFLPRALDPCCGSRMMWFDKQHPDAIFGDQRSETIVVTDRSHGNESGTRTLRIEPDTMLDFRAMPYPDGAFKLVAFDPPHLVRSGPRSWLAAKYGKLGKDWRDDLRQGFAECFRVLATDGVLVFKWNETQVRVGEVLPLAPIAPMFGQVSGRRGMTHWLVFMKPNFDIGRSFAP